MVLCAVWVMVMGVTTSVAGAAEIQHSLTVPSSALLGVVTAGYETQVSPGRSVEIAPQLYLQKVDGQYTAGGVGLRFTYRFYFNGQSIRGWYVGPVASLAYVRASSADASVNGLGGAAGAVLGWKGVWSGFTLDLRIGYGVTYNMLTARSGSFSVSQGELGTIPIGDISIGYSW